MEKTSAAQESNAVSLGISDCAGVKGGGLRVGKVEKFGSAGKAGIQQGDVLVSFNGKAVDSFETAQKIAEELGTGGSVKVRLIREGKPLDVEMKLRAKKKALKLDLEELDEVLERKISPSKIPT